MDEVKEEGVVRQRGTGRRWNPGSDADLIECVRTRPALYDTRNPRYSDNEHKAAVWAKIGRQLNAAPHVCKGRWNNIRDNYRKCLKRRLPGGRYKYSGAVSFLDRFLVPRRAGSQEKDETDAGDAGSSSDHPEEDEESIHETNDIDTSYIKININDCQDQEPMVDYEVFEEPTAPSCPAQAQAVDAFLGALAPPLKDLSPYLLSLAKAEIFAVVHKYELRGLRERGLGDVDPLP